MPIDLIVKGSKYTPEEIKLFEQTEQINKLIGDDNFPDETDPLKIAPLMPYKENIEWRQSQLDRVRDSHIPDGWEIFLDTKRRMGKVMHHSEFISRLRKLVPSLIVTDAEQLDRLSLYRVMNKLAGDDSHNYVKFVGWIEMGYMPEYEINLVNEFGEPCGQRRGYRTILLRLQISPDEDTGRPVLTEEEVLNEFGDPSGGYETATNYRAQLHAYRNNLQ